MNLLALVSRCCDRVFGRTKAFWGGERERERTSGGNWWNSPHQRLTGEHWKFHRWFTSFSPVIHQLFTGYFTNFVCKFEKEFHRWNKEKNFTGFSPVHRLSIPHPNQILRLLASTFYRPPHRTGRTLRALLNLFYNFHAVVFSSLLPLNNGIAHLSGQSARNFKVPRVTGTHMSK